MDAVTEASFRATARFRRAWPKASPYGDGSSGLVSLDG